MQLMIFHFNILSRIEDAEIKLQSYSPLSFQLKHQSGE